MGREREEKRQVIQKSERMCCEIRSVGLEIRIVCVCVLSNKRGVTLLVNALRGEGGDISICIYGHQDIFVIC